MCFSVHCGASPSESGCAVEKQELCSVFELVQEDPTESTPFKEGVFEIFVHVSH